MDDLPEEIWALDDQLEYPRLWEEEEHPEGVKYIRADKVEPLLSVLEKHGAALEALDRTESRIKDAYSDPNSYEKKRVFGDLKIIRSALIELKKAMSNNLSTNQKGENYEH